MDQELSKGLYLKWDNEVVGLIQGDYSVNFIHPNFNETLKIYTKGKDFWFAEQFVDFLSDRIVSRDRRDIERILFRLGLSYYDVIKIGLATRGIHPKDLLWIALDEKETIDSVATDVFESVFHQKIDLQGDSINSPEGYNIKRYGVYQGNYGIYKKRIGPLIKDAESEIAVSLLAKRLGVPCCPTYRVDDDTIFSAFLFDFSNEYIVHFRRLFDGERSENEYLNLVNVRPQYREAIQRMILLDFITRQDDRHLSNIAIKISESQESFYPLYDNGRSLFYEDAEDFVNDAVANLPLYSTSFGYSGTYYDYVQDIKAERGKLNGLINTDISREEIEEILLESGFEGYRLEGSLKWINCALDIIRI